MAATTFVVTSTNYNTEFVLLPKGSLHSHIQTGRWQRCAVADQIRLTTPHPEMVSLVSPTKGTKRWRASSSSQSFFSCRPTYRFGAVPGQTQRLFAQWIRSWAHDSCSRFQYHSRVTAVDVYDGQYGPAEPHPQQRVLGQTGRPDSLPSRAA